MRGASAATYYVDNSCAAHNGNGSCNGTAPDCQCAGSDNGAGPFNSIANMQAKAGGYAGDDNIYLKKGETFREQLTVPSSGSNGHPITFGAYGATGAKPIIDGTDLITSSWSAYSSNANDPINTYGTHDNGPIANYIYFVGPFTITSGGTVTSVSYRTKTTVSSATKVAIYTDNSGLPGTLVTNSSSNEVSQVANSWNTYIFGTNPTVSDSGTYWLAILSSQSFSTAWVDGGSMKDRYLGCTYANGFPASGSGSSADQTNIGSGGFYMTVLTPSTTVWSGAVTTQPYAVYFDGTLGTKVGSTAAVNGAGKWYWASNVLYIYSTSDPATAFTSPGVEATARGTVYMTGKSYITLQNLTLDKGGNDPSGSRSVSLRQSSNIILQDSSVTHSTGIGVDIYNVDGTTGDTTIQRCAFSDTGQSKVSADANSAIQTYGTMANNPTILVEHCTFQDIDNYGAHHGHGIYQNSGNLTWRYNHHYGDGMAGGAGSAVRLQGGTNYVYDNLITNEGTSKERAWGICGGGGTNYIYNNVFYGNHDAIYSPGGGTETYIVKNNIFSGVNGTFEHFINFTGAVTAYTGTNNNFYLNSGTSHWAWNNVDKTTAANWATASGESTYLTSSPLFVSTSTPDFHLQSTSPAINHGTDVDLTEDYAGNPVPSGSGYDIGAYEYQADTTPDAFVFTDITDASLSTEYTSNPITVAGIDDAAAITITGGTYSINGGAYTSDAGTVVAGNEVTVRVTSSGSFSTAVNAVLTIGGVSDTYTVTTLGDTVSDAFVFADITDATLSTQYTSNQITVAGIDTAAAISITGGTYSKNAGAYTSDPGTVAADDEVTVRVTSSGSFATAVDGILTIGEVSDTYTVTTLGEDTNPTSFTFTDITDADLSTVYTSNTITVAGINSPADITITGGTYSKNGGAYTADAGTVAADDTVRVRVTSSASYSTPTDAVLTIGTVEDTYTVTTLDEPSDTVPDAFVFTHGCPVNC